MLDVNVRVCICGKWPDHPVHTEDTMRYTDRSNDWEEEEITQYNVRKYGAYVSVSEEMLIDNGLSDGPSRFPEFRPSRISKIKWYLSLKVASIRLRLGSWVAGVDLDSYEP